MAPKTRKKSGVDENKPNDWCETLYSKTNEDGEGVPWTNMTPHPVFKNWIDETPNIGNEKQLW